MSFFEPVHTFDVELNNGKFQEFHVYQRSHGYELKIYVKSKDLLRTVKQANFLTVELAERFARQQVVSNGRMR